MRKTNRTSVSVHVKPARLRGLRNAPASGCQKPKFRMICHGDTERLNRPNKFDTKLQFQGDQDEFDS